MLLTLGGRMPGCEDDSRKGATGAYLHEAANLITLDSLADTLDCSTITSFPVG
ncbi:hypothetical protein [Paenibacillus sp. NAIST15-1]|uniref:hypothetical protein n=1 Tax=Paenibacillus sp. NAIST15-1 TaxID=1605994 RepID=UPI0015880500|nr:hypothetical protein [Paenibacillus sp. NAIST15-1]